MRYFFILSLWLFAGCSSDDTDHRRGYVISQVQVVPEDEQIAEE